MQVGGQSSLLGNNKFIISYKTNQAHCINCIKFFGKFDDEEQVICLEYCMILLSMNYFMMKDHYSIISLLFYFILSLCKSSLNIDLTDSNFGKSIFKVSVFLPLSRVLN